MHQYIYADLNWVTAIENTGPVDKMLSCSLGDKATYLLK